MIGLLRTRQFVRLAICKKETRPIRTQCQTDRIAGAAGERNRCADSTGLTSEALRGSFVVVPASFPASVKQLREHAIVHSLFRPTSLLAAIDRLGFVQADPIRAPARAQDLILRHRVRDYRAGDLERRYARLELEEDILYAYGFLPRPVWQYLHPRSAGRLPALERKVLDIVRRSGALHPRELEAHFGRERVINDWGGHSKATTRALEALHHRGLLRVDRRESGIRIYAAAPLWAAALPPDERLRRLVLVVANALAPAREKTLQAIAARLRRKIPRAGDHRSVIAGLLRGGELIRACVDGIGYVWPSGSVRAQAHAGSAARRVRFLSPFDPLVWDRRRFEHLWQWSYRFEAYTPPAQRLRGYYAMPVLWGERMIGWANAAVAGGKLSVELGFVEQGSAEREFQREAQAEIARLEKFLDPA